MGLTRTWIAIWFSCLVLVWSAAKMTRAADGPSPAAEVISVQGEGQFRVEANAPWNAVIVHQDLFQGNYVRTGIYSCMGLLFADRTQIRLNERTVLQVKEVRDPPARCERTLLRLTTEARAADA